MKFGEKISASRHPPWAEHYIDYLRLKRLLGPLFDAGVSIEEGVVGASALRVGAPKSSDGVTSSDGFQVELNHEIQKALLFLMKSTGELAADLTDLAEQRRAVSVHVQSLLQQKPMQDAMQQQLEGIEQLRMEYLVRIGRKLLLLLEFVELNVEAIVKIVKKHDKLLSRWEQPQHKTTGGKSRYTRLRRQYLPRFAVYSSNPNVRCLFLTAADAGDCSSYINGRTATRRGSGQSVGNYGGWDVVQWNLEKALKELFQCERELKNALEDRSADTTGEALESVKPLSSRSFSEIPQSFFTGSPVKRILTQSSLLQALSSPPKALDKPTFFEPVLYQIQSSRRRLGAMHSRYIRMVFAHEMIGENVRLRDDEYLMQRREMETVEAMERIRKASIGGEEDGREILKGPTVSNLSKLLNLASAGLYMCNYNIVAPTSALYAEHLGFDEASGGIIIGMTPAAVILSSVLYSWWSSYSYKRALMFASSCCMLGNAVYALALPCNSLKMVLLGRLLTGFGSARVINRRYIADYYNIEDRTAGMADFVSASALGMALGPGLAALLSVVAPDHLSESNSLWTVETAPGYVMFVLWAVYLILNVLFFEEPDRVGRSPSRSQPRRDKPDTTTHTESSPLLNNPIDGALSISTAQSLGSTNPLLKACGNVPVLISLALLVLLKSVLEGISSSAPTISRYYFGWGVHATGIYLAVLASCVLPTNFLVASISRRFDDRELILGTLVAMFIGILGFLVYSQDGQYYSEARFVVFGILTFAACNALEGPTMGLLSKTISKSLAVGVLNAGLLATEAGTLGRVVGDFWLSAATYMGKNEMLNRTFQPMCAMVGVSIFATYWTYPQLQPTFATEDEDDD